MTCCKVWQWRFVHLYVNMCMIMKKESTRVFRFGKNNKPPSPQVTICRRGSCSKIVVPLRRMSYRADHSGIMRKKTFNILRRKNAGLENDCKNQVEKKNSTKCCSRFQCRTDVFCTDQRTVVGPWSCKVPDPTTTSFTLVPVRPLFICLGIFGHPK